MLKLVLLSPGMTGRTLELKEEKTTIGRVEDNAFQIAEPSVSSHHCEVVLRGNDVVVKDLNSTNGTFIGNDKVTETVLKPGQVVRLGQVEMRLETDTPAPASPKKLEQTMVMQRGVSLNELERTGGKPGGFDTASKGFSRKDDRFGKFFWIGAIVFGVVILAVIAWMLLNVKS